MTAICPTAIHLCKTRVTRLDQLGNPAPGPHNVYVSDSALDLIYKPVIEAGQDKTLVGGCDCLVAVYKGYDKLKRFDLELDLTKLETGLIEMLTGGSAIVAAGDPIGMWFPSQIACSDAVQPNLCIEGWQDMWDEDHAYAGPAAYRYIHWIWPSSRWQLSDGNLQNDFNQPKLMGYTRSNPQWGLGIYADLPEPCKPMGGYFFDSHTPDAACGWQTKIIT